jgi:hypothetical protein
MDITDQIKYMRFSLPFLIHKNVFLNEVNKNLIFIGVTLPWDLGRYDTLIPLVVKYNNFIYDRNNIQHFLKMLSAIYEHYDAIKKVS